MAGLLGFVVIPVLLYVDGRRIRNPDETWTLFSEWTEKQKVASPVFWKFCEERSFNKSSVLPVSGFRILSVKSLASSSARGYPSPVDFYASFSERHADANSLVEAIQAEIRLEKLPIIFEFTGEDGKWKRSSFDAGLERLVTMDAHELVASHGLVFEQVATGHEKDFTIYGVSISVVDLASNMVVAKNVGFTRDQYWGVHNHYSLLPRGDRCGYPDEDNYVGVWLSSLVRKPIPGATNHYDGFSRRPEVVDEDMHWSSRCSSPTIVEKWPKSRGDLGGEIVSFDNDVLVVMRGNTSDVVSVRVPRESRVYRYHGGRLNIDELLVGEKVRVWFADCGAGEPSPEAAHIGVYTNLASSRIKDLPGVGDRLGQ